MTGVDQPCSVSASGLPLSVANRSIRKASMGSLVPPWTARSARPTGDRPEAEAVTAESRADHESTPEGCCSTGSASGV